MFQLAGLPVLNLRAHTDRHLQRDQARGGVIRGIGTADSTIDVGTLKGKVHAWLR